MKNETKSWNIKEHYYLKCAASPEHSQQQQQQQNEDVSNEQEISHRSQKMNKERQKMKHKQQHKNYIQFITYEYHAEFNAMHKNGITHAPHYGKQNKQILSLLCRWPWYFACTKIDDAPLKQQSGHIYEWVASHRRQFQMFICFALRANFLSSRNTRPIPCLVCFLYSFGVTEKIERRLENYATWQWVFDNCFNWSEQETFQQVLTFVAYHLRRMSIGMHVCGCFIMWTE